MAAIIAEAMQYNGYSLIDVLQPCVTFNKLNTYDWYRGRIYKLEEGYDASDFNTAWEKAHEWEERIPTGVLYRREGTPTYEDQVPQLQDTSPLKQTLALWENLRPEQYEPLKEQFL
jgi:2-oxoglutarate ferredoxin oxidoreductase subunit beta